MCRYRFLKKTFLIIAIAGPLYGSFPFDPERVIGHMKVIKELKKRFLRNTKKRKSQPFFGPAQLTQSKAYLNAVKGTPYLADYDRRKLEEGYRTHKDLVEKVFKKEQEYNDSYYVFYHAQRTDFNIVRDFIKEIYANLALKPMGNNFQFLRNWITANPMLNTKQFLGDSQTRVNDHEAENIKRLLSVNLSLFGNVANSGENTFSYFLTNLNINPPVIEGLLVELFDYFGFNPVFIKQLMQLNTILATNEGVLLQIFIPKETVDEYVYLSEPLGNPYRKELISDIYDSKLQRHIRISPILEQYQRNPNLLGNFDELQARILLSQDGLLNPESGILIFKYTTACKYARQVYQKQLAEIVAAIFADFFAQTSQEKIANTKLGKLLTLMQV